MPKDYSDVSGIMQGAQMAMQAYGIKNERDMQKYNQQMQDRQMALQEKRDMREMNAADMASKIAKLQYDREAAETERYNRNKDMMLTEDAIKKSQLEATKLAMVRNKTSADTFRKTGGFAGTEYDFMNEPFAMAQESGDYKTMADLAKGLIETGGLGGSIPKSLTDNQLYAMSVDPSNPYANQARAILDAKQKEKIDLAEGRGEAYNFSKTKSAFDTETGEVVEVPISALSEDYKTNPNKRRYLSGPAAEKAAKQVNLIQDINMNIESARKSISNLKDDFSEKTRAQLYLAMKSSHPESVLGNLIYGEFGKKLTPEQVDYVTDMLVLVENAMAMRSILGAGQGSDELRRAISATVPSSGTFSKEYANAQLDKFSRTLKNLSKGIPGGKRVTEALFGDKTPQGNTVEYNFDSNGNLIK